MQALCWYGWLVPSFLPLLREAVAPGFFSYSFFHVLVKGPGTGRLLVSFCFVVWSSVSPHVTRLSWMAAAHGAAFSFLPCS